MYNSSVNQIATPRPGQIAFALLDAVHQVEAELERALETVGLSLAKYGVLARLAEAEEPLTLGALADRCACVRSNITQLVDRLESERLVERSADPQDRRAIRARLTEAGRARHLEGARMLEETESLVLTRLPDTGRESLVHLLGLLKAG